MTTTKPTDPLSVDWAIVDTLSFIAKGEGDRAVDRLVGLAKDFGYTIHGEIVRQAREALA